MSARRRPRRRLTVAMVSQVYVPDPASVGQYMADAAEELARRGHRVVVFTSARGYDDASVRYANREWRAGVDVRRLPMSWFGKGSITRRLLGGLAFVVQATVRALLLPRLDALVVTTTPPLAPVIAVLVHLFRRTRVSYWVMDLNPDQLVAVRGVSPRASVVRLFDWLNRRMLSAADDVVVLDRFMADRVSAKHDVTGKLRVIPPWPHEQHVEPVAMHINPFRERYARPDAIVVMYSGNHSLANPLDTVLQAARRLEDDDRFLFMFIGGGVAKNEVDTVGAANVLSLPYQPLQEIRYSLSAADIHIVTLGNQVVGIVHPSKVYAAMGVGRPVLYVGPCPSHVSDIIDSGGVGWGFRHGDVDGVVRLLQRLADARQELVERGHRALHLVRTRYAKASLCGAFCDGIEALGDPVPMAAPARERTTV